MTDRSGKTTSDDSASPGWFVFVEDADDTPCRRESLPNLSSANASVLNTLLEEACSAPDDWYRLPETDLALRVIPTGGVDHAFRFEICTDQSPGGIRRYHYDSRRRVLTCRKNYAIEYYEPPLPKHELAKGTDGTDQFALSIAALVGSWPASTHFSGRFMRVEANEAETISPVQNALAIVIQGLRNQWLGLAVNDFSIKHRFLYAFGGSITFFVVWMMVFLIPENAKLSIASLRSDPLLQGTVLFALTFVVSPLSAWFAWLVSWKAQRYGPTRLYMAGFLLPYFVWFLIQRMYDI